MDLVYPCVCCGYQTMTEPPGSHDICPICHWEDDVYQLRRPYRARGANILSLIEAQRDFYLKGPGSEGESNERWADPADYGREPHWRKIDLQRDHFEPGSRALGGWPEDRTVLYWWRRRRGQTWWEDPQAIEPQEHPTEAADPTAFAAAVRAVASVAPPADPDNLSGMSTDFDHYLLRCPSIREVAVNTTPESAQQITAFCLAEPAASPMRVALEVEQIWLSDLRYSYWEVHRLEILATYVNLEVATQIDEDGY
ncbi:CPCC family cysteine-rich protein [Micromonospora sp. LOL_021]|uniref:CPCC family cysteine-rich protein n=1 Tax=Micromonospora sp. LOL_021 TaxID=3345417 RepID=UPI003A879A6A